MDFSQFKTVEVANTRKASSLPTKTQEFSDLKYRKAQTKKNGIRAMFYLSEERFEGLGINKDHALVHFIHPSDKSIILIGVVDEANGKYLKKRVGRDKGDSFKSEALEAALHAAGIINSSAIGLNQFIAMTKVGEKVNIDGTPVHIVFQLSKGEKKKQAEKEQTSTTEATVAATVPVAEGSTVNASTASTESTASAPEAQAAPAAKSDWD